MTEPKSSSDHRWKKKPDLSGWPFLSRLRSRRRRWRVGMGLVVVVVILGMAAGCGLYAWRFNAVSGELTVGPLSLDRVPDGDHRGFYRLFHVAAQVLVSVRDGKITGIQLLNYEKMQRADADRTQRTLERVVESQSLDVDLETGATVTQKVALKAVENALTGAGGQ